MAPANVTHEAVSCQLLCHVSSIARTPGLIFFRGCRTARELLSSLSLDAFFFSLSLSWLHSPKHAKVVLKCLRRSLKGVGVNSLCFFLKFEEMGERDLSTLLRTLAVLWD